MATMTINIPDAQLSKVVDGMCINYNYEPLINGLPNPETKAVFARRMLIELLKRAVAAGEAKTARLAAEATLALT